MKKWYWLVLWFYELHVCCAQILLYGNMILYLFLDFFFPVFKPCTSRGSKSAPIRKLSWFGYRTTMENPRHNWSRGSFLFVWFLDWFVAIYRNHVFPLKIGAGIFIANQVGCSCKRNEIAYKRYEILEIMVENVWSFQKVWEFRYFEIGKKSAI